VGIAGSVMTGRTHTIFVQTRDRYGNYISADPEEFPEGADLVEFEFCSTVGETCEDKEGCVCSDGEVNIPKSQRAIIFTI
jgi:hypothetical protein